MIYTDICEIMSILLLKLITTVDLTRFFSKFTIIAKFIIVKIHKGKKMEKKCFGLDAIHNRRKVFQKKIDSLKILFSDF